MFLNIFFFVIIRYILLRFWMAEDMLHLKYLKNVCKWKTFISDSGTVEGDVMF